MDVSSSEFLDPTVNRRANPEDVIPPIVMFVGCPGAADLCSCSFCGAVYEYRTPSGRNDAEKFNYCPNCSKKVVV